MEGWGRGIAWAVGTGAGGWFFWWVGRNALDLHWHWVWFYLIIGFLSWIFTGPVPGSNINGRV